MKEEILQDFGLTKNEAKVYLTLLNLGSSRAGEITEKSGIHRRNVYDSIERLSEKGLVSHVIVNNKKLFNPANPNRFFGIIEEKKRFLDLKKKNFEKILPELNLMRNISEKHDVRFFKGAEGIKTIYEDILRTKKNYVGYGPGQQLEKILKYYFIHYTKKRKKAKIITRLIYDEKSRGKIFTRAPLSKIRFLPDRYSSHAALRIYGSKVAILLLSEKEPIGVIINSQEVADGYKKYFEVVWESAKK